MYPLLFRSIDCFKSACVCMCHLIFFSQSMFEELLDLFSNWLSTLSPPSHLNGLVITFLFFWFWHFRRPHLLVFLSFLQKIWQEFTHYHEGRASKQSATSEKIVYVSLAWFVRFFRNFCCCCCCCYFFVCWFWILFYSVGSPHFLMFFSSHICSY